MSCIRAPKYNPGSSFVPKIVPEVRPATFRDPKQDTLVCRPNQLHSHSIPEEPAISGYKTRQLEISRCLNRYFSPGSSAATKQEALDILENFFEEISKISFSHRKKPGSNDFFRMNLKMGFETGDSSTSQIADNFYNSDIHAFLSIHPLFDVKDVLEDQDPDDENSYLFDLERSEESPTWCQNLKSSNQTFRSFNFFIKDILSKFNDSDISRPQLADKLIRIAAIIADQTNKSIRYICRWKSENQNQSDN